MQYQKNGNRISQNIVSIEDRAFLYGDGCFTTARVIRGEITLWQRHLQRLNAAMQALSLNCDIQRIKTEKEIFWVNLPEQASGVLKIILSRGVGQRGYAMPQQPCDVYFCFYPLTTPQQYPSILSKVGCIDETLGNSMLRIKGVKSLNRLEQVLMKDLVVQQQWDEGLCFDQQHHLVEGISSNCFMYIAGHWVTPDLALTGIDGTMRKEILTRMTDYQIPYQIRIISRAEMSSVQAGFLCNAVQPMQMIEQLILKQDNVKTLDQNLCRQLFETLQLDELV